jgi:hypothetical protein
MERLARRRNVCLGETQPGPALRLRSRHPWVAQPHEPARVLRREKVQRAALRPRTHNLVLIDGGEHCGVVKRTAQRQGADAREVCLPLQRKHPTRCLDGVAGG